MRTIILGSGQVGFSIARYLVQEDNHVTIVDQSASILKSISDKLDIQPVLGFASHPDVLEKAGAKDADLLIAVTSSDEVNIVACEVANCLFQVPLKIARIRHQNYLSPNWAELWQQHNLAIDVIISPEIEVAHAICRSTQVEGAFDMISLAQNLIKIIGVRCHSQSPIINTPIRLINGLFPRLDVAIICINRKNKPFFPREEDVLLVDDEVHFLVKSQDVTMTMEAFGYYASALRQLLIIGGGAIGQNLALEIERQQPNILVKMIEKSLDRCEVAAKNLHKTEVLVGDALDFDVLQEANVQNIETVITVTNDDKVNILSSLLSKRYGANRVLTLLNNMNYASLVTSLGVDAVINPQALTVSTILRHVRQGKIHTAHALAEGYVVIIEAEVKETSHIIGLSVEDVTIPGSAVIMVLVRQGHITISPNHMIISANDRLIIMATKESVPKVEKLFAIRPSYL